MVFSGKTRHAMPGDADVGSDDDRRVHDPALLGNGDLVRPNYKSGVLGR